MIKVRGWQVSPAELEAALLLHPDISDAAVVGIFLGHSDETELPRAYVVKDPNSDLSESEVKRFMAFRVARYKNLDGGVSFIHAIPRSSAGKILKGRLKDQAAAEIREPHVKLENKLSASASLNARPSSVETGSVSLGSSVTSYDGTNETGSQSRRDSISTAETTNSEATRWMLRSARTAASTRDDFKYYGKPVEDPAATDLQAEDKAAEDPRTRIGYAFTERGSRMSDAVAPQCMSDVTFGNDEELRASQETMKAPTLVQKASSTSHCLAPPDLKKRLAEKNGSPKTNSKKLKVGARTTNPHATADQAYKRAMAMIMKDLEGYPD